MPSKPVKADPTTGEIAAHVETNLAVIRQLPDKMDMFRAMTLAMRTVPHPLCARPVPRFMFAMPWAGDDDEIQERIIAKMLMADDPYANADAGETLAGKGLVGRKITVHDVRCAPSTKEGGWGAYLICDVTLDDDETHEVMTIGAKEAVSKLALAFFEDKLPMTGSVTVTTVTAGGNTVLGFVVEDAF